MPKPLAIVIMAKYPTPGRVKTRLQPVLSEDESAEVQRVFLLHVLERLVSLEVGDVIVCYDPPDATEAFEALVEARAGLLPQSGGDLGDRLANAEIVLRADYDRVLFFGVDSPDVPEKHLLEMIRQTLVHDATLAPAEDGGFWAMGVRTSVDLAEVLRGIEWSSGREYAQTTDRLKSHGCTVGVGRRWFDIDRASDLIALNERLIGSHAADDRLLFAQLKDVWPVLARDGVSQ
jgi:rSAM/selenodomain-associated transferase 1